MIALPVHPVYEPPSSESCCVFCSSVKPLLLQNATTLSKAGFDAESSSNPTDRYAPFLSSSTPMMRLFAGCFMPESPKRAHTSSAGISYTTCSSGFIATVAAIISVPLRMMKVIELLPVYAV